MDKITLVRIDYAPLGTKCDANCGRELEMAHVAIDSNGNERFYGSECIKKVIPESILKQVVRTVPNLTIRGANSESSTGANRCTGNAIGNSGVVSGVDDNEAIKQAAEYLLVRVGKVAEICPSRKNDLQWGFLKDAFKNLTENNEISIEMALKILRLESGQNIDPAYKRINLLDVYSGVCQLERKLGKIGKPDKFLDSILSQLKRNLHISQSQIKAAKITLPATAFDWYKPKTKDMDTSTASQPAE